MQFLYKKTHTTHADIAILPTSSNTPTDAEVIKKIADAIGRRPEQLLKMVETEGQLCLLHTDLAARLYLLHVKTPEAFGETLKTFKRFSYKEKKHLHGKIQLILSETNLLAAAVQGLLLGTYQIGLYKTTEKTPSNVASWQCTVVSHENQKRTKKVVTEAIATATTQMRVMDLVNAPGNKCTPDYLADWAVKSGKKHGYKVTVFDKKAIRKTGLHALLAVNSGSALPPTFTLLEYRPKGEKQYPKIGLAGKGVTFDTGGLSIKGATNMHYMKSDMGGAAAILGTVELAAKLQLPVHIIAAIPATDNCVGSHATRPGDVIDSYSGKTIEVIDTDAEGRLILADALAYLQKNYHPDTMINAATLTGSCVRTLGYHAGGLFTVNDVLAQQLLDAGQRTGERLWRLPLWDEYFEDIKSDVADIKNLPAKPLAGATVAGKFLEFFTGAHPQWAHLDIAGVAFGNSGLSNEKSATAFGVQLLVDYLKQL